MRKETSKKQIAEKQWRVLEYFIVEESKQIEKYLVNKKLDEIEKRSHFRTYPGKIERDMKDMTRVTAKKACETFHKMQILEVLEEETGEHLKGRDITPYCLKSDLNTLRRVVKLIFEQLSYSDAMKLLDNYYFTYNINDSLIRQVLSEKKVMVSRTFSIIDLDLKSAQRLLEINGKNNKHPENVAAGKINVSNKMKILANEFEQKIKRDELSHINQLCGFCSEFLKSIEDSYTSANRRLPDFESWIIKLYERFFHYSSTPNMNYQSHDFSLLNTFTLKLPVFEDSISESDKIERIKEANFRFFYYVYYEEGLLDFSHIVNIVVTNKEQILDILQDIDKNFELSNDISLSQNFGDKLETLIEKWIESIERNKEIFSSQPAKQLLEDIEFMHADLRENVTRVKVKNERNSNFESMIKRIDSLYEEMKKYIEKYLSIKKLPNDFIENNFKTLFYEHYEIFELEKLVIPILSLIQASPLALKEFLNGEWESFELSFDIKGEMKNSAFVAKLIHIASINLLIYPKVLSKSIVKSASMEKPAFPDWNQSLSEYHSKLNQEDYYKLFDIIKHDFTNNIRYAEIQSYEPSFLKIKLKQLYELAYVLNFNAEYNLKSDVAIYTRIDIKKHSDFDLQLFKISHIKDPTELVSKLKSEDMKVGHIRKMFSIRMQNTILFIDVDSEPSLNFLKELLGEFNNIILNPKLYDEHVFFDARTELKSILKTYQRLSNIQILRMVNENPSYHNYFIGGNRYLLELIFRDEFDSDFVDTFNQYLDQYALHVKRGFLT